MAAGSNTSQLTGVIIKSTLTDKIWPTFGSKSTSNFHDTDKNFLVLLSSKNFVCDDIIIILS